MEGANQYTYKVSWLPCCMAVRGAVTTVTTDLYTGKEFAAWKLPLWIWKLNCYMYAYNVKVTQETKQMFMMPSKFTKVFINLHSGKHKEHLLGTNCTRWVRHYFCHTSFIHWILAECLLCARHCWHRNMAINTNNKNPGFQGAYILFLILRTQSNTDYFQALDWRMGGLQVIATNQTRSLSWLDHLNSDEKKYCIRSPDF